MAKFKGFNAGGRAPWMIIFSDMMTLLLTFFIILVSMSVIDEQSRLRAVESVRRVFGKPDRIFNYDRERDAQGLSSWGESTRPEDRLQEARQLLFADNQNMTLRTTATELVVEVSGDMLFEPGGASISAAGRVALDRMVPFLLRMSYPAVIAGHAAPGYSEGVGTNLSAERLADSSWGLSLARSLAVYRHFVSRGVPRQLLLMESFGAHHPEYDNKTAEGRRRNRRVDIVLDKRNPVLPAGFERLGGGSGEYNFRDFIFNLDVVPPQGTESSGEGGGR